VVGPPISDTSTFQRGAALFSVSRFNSSSAANKHVPTRPSSQSAQELQVQVIDLGPLSLLYILRAATRSPRLSCASNAQCALLCTLH
jgi:hypothetical protein